MEVLSRLKDLEFRKKTGNRLFYIALLIELILMILEKSEIPFSYESYVFRITFVITMLAVLIAGHEKKEWLVIGLVLAFTFVCYRLTGRNELLRYAVFVMAARNINLGKTMKMTFWICLAGFAAIALLSITGILGQVSMITDYGRNNTEELRYVFGFGHPNTFWGCMYVLILLWIWVYGSRARIWQMAVVFVISIVVSLYASSRTGLIIGVFTVLIAALVRYVPVLNIRKYIYVLSALITPVLCVAFSIWAACVSHIPYYVFDAKGYYIITAIDGALNNRIYNLYRGNNRHAGAIDSWKLFSDHDSIEYFDMGWIRMFYWYGIIPTVIICALVIVFIYLCYKRKDTWTLILIVSLSIYTIIEATFVSVYIGRNILLPILGVYLGAVFERKPVVNAGKN